MEEDPNGLDAKTPGAKLDRGKNRLGLVISGFSTALEEVGKVGTYGANKYSEGGWLKVPNGVSRYHDALYRHLNAFDRGESIDAESGLPHLSHVAWNVLALLELINRSKLTSNNDDIIIN